MDVITLQKNNFIGDIVLVKINNGEVKKGQLNEIGLSHIKIADYKIVNEISLDDVTEIYTIVRKGAIKPKGLNLNPFEEELLRYNEQKIRDYIGKAIDNPDVLLGMNYSLEEIKKIQLCFHWGKYTCGSDDYSVAIRFFKFQGNKNRIAAYFYEQCLRNPITDLETKMKAKNQLLLLYIKKSNDNLTEEEQKEKEDIYYHLATKYSDIPIEDEQNTPYYLSLLYARNKYQEICAIYDKITKSMNNMDYYLISALSLMRCGKYDTAMAIFEEKGLYRSNILDLLMEFIRLGVTQFKLKLKGDETKNDYINYLETIAGKLIKKGSINYSNLFYIFKNFEVTEYNLGYFIDLMRNEETTDLAKERLTQLFTQDEETIMFSFEEMMSKISFVEYKIFASFLKSINTFELSSREKWLMDLLLDKTFKLPWTPDKEVRTVLIKAIITLTGENLYSSDCKRIWIELTRYYELINRTDLARKCNYFSVYCDDEYKLNGSMTDQDQWMNIAIKNNDEGRFEEAYSAFYETFLYCMNPDDRGHQFSRIYLDGKNRKNFSNTFKMNFMPTMKTNPELAKKYICLFSELYMERHDYRYTSVSFQIAEIAGLYQYYVDVFGQLLAQYDCVKGISQAFNIAKTEDYSSVYSLLDALKTVTDEEEVVNLRRVSLLDFIKTIIDKKDTDSINFPYYLYVLQGYPTKMIISLINRSEIKQNSDINQVIAFIQDIEKLYVLSLGLVDEFKPIDSRMIEKLVNSISDIRYELYQCFCQSEREDRIIKMREYLSLSTNGTETEIYFPRCSKLIGLCYQYDSVLIKYVTEIHSEIRGRKSENRLSSTLNYFDQLRDYIQNNKSDDSAEIYFLLCNIQHLYTIDSIITLIQYAIHNKVYITNVELWQQVTPFLIANSDIFHQAILSLYFKIKEGEVTKSLDELEDFIRYTEETSDLIEIIEFLNHLDNKELYKNAFSGNVNVYSLVKDYLVCAHSKEEDEFLYHLLTQIMREYDINNLIHNIVGAILKRSNESLEIISGVLKNFYHITGKTQYIKMLARKYYKNGEYNKAIHLYKFLLEDNKNPDIMDKELANVPFIMYSAELLNKAQNGEKIKLYESETFKESESILLYALGYIKKKEPVSIMKKLITSVTDPSDRDLLNYVDKVLVREDEEVYQKSISDYFDAFNILYRLPKGELHKKLTIDYYARMIMANKENMWKEAEKCYPYLQELNEDYVYEDIFEFNKKIPINTMKPSIEKIAITNESSNDLLQYNEQESNIILKEIHSYIQKQEAIKKQKDIPYNIETRIKQEEFLEQIKNIEKFKGKHVSEKEEILKLFYLLHNTSKSLPRDLSIDVNKYYVRLGRILFHLSTQKLYPENPTHIIFDIISHLDANSNHITEMKNRYLDILSLKFYESFEEIIQDIPRLLIAGNNLCKLYNGPEREFLVNFLPVLKKMDGYDDIIISMNNRRSILKSAIGAKEDIRSAGSVAHMKLYLSKVKSYSLNHIVSQWLRLLEDKQKNLYEEPIIECSINSAYGDKEGCIYGTINNLGKGIADVKVSLIMDGVTSEPAWSIDYLKVDDKELDKIRLFPLDSRTFCIDYDTDNYKEYEGRLLIDYEVVVLDDDDTMYYKEERVIRTESFTYPLILNVRREEPIIEYNTQNLYNLCPAGDDAMLYGRTNEIKKIEGYLEDRINALCIYGLKRIGKSSILTYCWKHSLNENYVPVLLSAESAVLVFGSDSEQWDSLLPTFLKDIFIKPVVSEIRRIEEKQGLHKGCISIGDYWNENNEALLIKFEKTPLMVIRDFFENIQKVIGDKRLLLMIDEVEYLFTHDAINEYNRMRIVDFLRYVVKNIRSLLIVICGANGLTEMLKTTDSYVNNAFEVINTIEISLLSKESMKELLLGNYVDQDGEKKALAPIYDESAIDRIWYYTHGNPYYTKIFATFLLSFRTERTLKPNDHKLYAFDVDNVLAELMTKEGYFAYLWNILTDPERELIRYLNERLQYHEDKVKEEELMEYMKNNNLTHDNSLGKLLYKFILVEDGEREYKFAIELFRIWYKRKR